MPRILVVEDNPDTQTLLRYLVGAQHELVLASRVDEALEAARQQRFELFILDINLGEQRTGIDLLEALRAEDANVDVPAIALTAYALPGDRERFLGAGFETYVAKPFTRQELQEAVAATIAATRA